MVSDQVSSYHEYPTKVGVEVGCRVGVVVRRMKWAELNAVVGKLYQHSFQYILLSAATDRRETRNE